MTFHCGVAILAHRTNNDILKMISNASKYVYNIYGAVKRTVNITSDVIIS